jgi:hypothetical protein
MKAFRATCVAAVLIAAVLGIGAQAKSEPNPPWTSAEPPMFSPLTLSSGSVYTLIQAGALQPTSGSKPLFAVFYVGSSRDMSAVVAAAQELFEAWRRHWRRDCITTH